MPRQRTTLWRSPETPLRRVRHSKKRALARRARWPRCAGRPSTGPERAPLRRMECRTLALWLTKAPRTLLLVRSTFRARNGMPARRRAAQRGLRRHATPIPSVHARADKPVRTGEACRTRCRDRGICREEVLPQRLWGMLLPPTEYRFGRSGPTRLPRPNRPGPHVWSSTWISLFSTAAPPCCETLLHTQGQP